MTHPRLQHGRAPLGLAHALLAVTLLAGHATRADDRPFLRLDTAKVEDDSDHTLEVSSLLSQTRAQQALQVRLEYNVNPLLAAEMELGQSRERAGPAREHDLELGVRQVLVDHHREGWGLAMRWALDWQRSAPGAWAFEGPVAVAIALLPLADRGTYLHANLGVSRSQSQDNTRAVWGLGADHVLTRQFTLFGELGGRVLQDRLLHGGVRWWLRHDKVALDVSASRTRTLATGEVAQGVHVGLNFFDLDF